MEVKAGHMSGQIVVLHLMAQEEKKRKGMTKLFSFSSTISQVLHRAGQILMGHVSMSFPGHPFDDAFAATKKKRLYLPATI